MQITRDYYNNLEIPDFVLCKANRERIGVIPCTEKSVDFNFGDMNEINFTTFYMMDGEINPIYNSIEVMKYVLVPGVGFFYIQTCNIQSSGSEHEYKEVTALSFEGLLGQKYLENFIINTGETGSKELEFDETGATHIYIWLSPSEKLSTGRKDLFDYILEKCPDWYVAYVDPLLLEEGRSHRSFDIDRQDAYSFIMNDVQEAFECYVEFDTVHTDNKGRCPISIYAQENYKYDTDIYVSYDNLLKSTNISSSTDDIKTCVVLEGEDELEIREINFGYDRIYNFDYYNNTDFWSQRLYDEYNAWHDKVYEIGSIERSPNVYTEDLTDEELEVMSYLDLYKLRLNGYLDALVELDEINTLTSDFVNDDDRHIGSGEFPVFDDEGNEIGSITFEQDIGVYLTEQLPSSPPFGKENYIFILKDADVNITQLRNNLSKVETGKNITYVHNPSYPTMKKSIKEELGNDYTQYFQYLDEVTYKIININGFYRTLQNEERELQSYIRDFSIKKNKNYDYRHEDYELDYEKYNKAKQRIKFLQTAKNNVIWVNVPPTPTIPNSVATNLINYSSLYSNYLIAGYSSTHYSISNESAYKNQLSVDTTSLKNLIEVSINTSTVTYPGYCIYRWFDNTDTRKFYNALVSANSSYESTKTISVADATTLRDYNPLYNTCLIIGSSTVDISDEEDFEEYLEADLTEQTALITKFPQSTWFNTNDWQGYGYSELTDTWALTVDQELTVLRKDNKGTVPDTYKEAEVDEYDHYYSADSTPDIKSAWYYFGEYLPCYLTQLAIEAQIAALDNQINGYDVYDYALNSKGSVAFNNLPSSGNSRGDTYVITDAFVLDGISYPSETNVTWDGSKWIPTSSITTHIDGIQDRIDKQYLYKSQVVDEIQLDNNLTEPSRIELSAFVREEELTSDNFVVTDTMTEEERQEMLNSFLEYGEKELSKICIPQLTFTADIVNLFSIPEFDCVSAKFEPGKTIYVSLRDDFNVKATLLTVHVNYYDPTDFTMTFSDIKKKSEGLYTDLQDAINTATSAATSVAIGSSSWSAGASTATEIYSSLQDGLLSQGAYLKDNPAKSTFVIDETGIFVDTASGDYGKYDVFGEEKYVYDSIYIGGGRILFTDDGWQHVRMSLGRSKVTRISPTNPNGFTSEEFGVYADFVISGYVAGSQICGGELYSSKFTTNKNGSRVPVSYWNLNNGRLTIYDSSGGNDPVFDFNGTKLSINGEIKAFTGEIGGFKITESSLYNTKASLDDATNGVYIGTDGIALGKKDSGSAFKVASDGTLTATKGTFSGNITASNISSGTISGTDINNGNGTFHVDKNGNLTANSATITGTITSNNATLTNGSIAGWNFNNYSLSAGNLHLNSNGSIGFGDVSIGPSMIGTTQWGITCTGYFKINNELSVSNAAEFLSNSDFYGQARYYNYITSEMGCIRFINENNDAVGFWQSATNTIAVTTDTTWGNMNDTGKLRANITNTSDLRYKKIVDEEMSFSKDFIMKLKPFVYKWDDYGDDIQAHMGFGAQQVEAVLESLKLYDCGLVDIPDNEKSTWGLSYHEIIAPLVKLVQAQQNKLDELEEKIERINNDKI